MSQQQEMPYEVYLDKDGLAQVARGERPYAWNFQVVGEYEKPRDFSVKVAEFQPELPDPDRARAGAVMALRDKQQKIRAEAEIEAGEIEQQIQQLLAIEGPKA